MGCAFSSLICHATASLDHRDSLSCSLPMDWNWAMVCDVHNSEEAQCGWATSRLFYGPPVRWACWHNRLSHRAQRHGSIPLVDPITYRSRMRIAVWCNDRFRYGGWFSAPVTRKEGLKTLGGAGARVVPLTRADAFLEFSPRSQAPAWERTCRQALLGNARNIGRGTFRQRRHGLSKGMDGSWITVRIGASRECVPKRSLGTRGSRRGVRCIWQEFR